MVGSQIPPFEKSAELRDNGRQDATYTPSSSPSELAGDVGDVKLRDKNILDLELIGTTSPDEQSDDDDWTQKHFQKTVRMESRRWMSTWPWKNKIPYLLTNEASVLNEWRYRGGVMHPDSIPKEDWDHSRYREGISDGYTQHLLSQGSSNPRFQWLLTLDSRSKANKDCRQKTE